MTSLYPSLAANQEYWPLLLMLAEGVSSTYGQRAAPLNQLLTKTGIKLIGSAIKSEPQCLLGVLGTVGGSHSYNQVFLSQPLSPSWQTLLNESDPASFSAAGSAPVLIVHGSADTTAPTSTSASLAQSLCSLKSTSAPGAMGLCRSRSHQHHGQHDWAHRSKRSADSAYQNSASAGDPIQWMSDRFADGIWPDPDVPTGAGLTTVSQTDTC